MKIFEVASKVTGSGEYILGADATGSHACYLIYGILKPGEAGRELKPGRGHEEMVLCISGEMQLSGGYSGSLEAGRAIHLRGEESCSAANLGATPAIYVTAGGHSEQEHGHHEQ